MSKSKLKRRSTENREEEPEAKIRHKNEKSSKLDVQESENVINEDKTNDPQSIKYMKKTTKPQSDKKPSTKLNWSDFKKKKPFFDKTCKSKTLWEKVRRHDCPVEKRKKLIQEMYDILKGNLSKVVLSHDLSRIVQCLLKLGPSDVKQNVIEELTNHVPAMLQSKYAFFCVKNMLKHGSNTSRRAIVNSLFGNIVKLASHSIAGPRLEIIYSEWATGIEKNQMKLEFYGDICKQNKESSLQEIFDKTPDLKDAILSALKINITKILGKKLTKSSLLHSVFLEFLKHCSEADREALCAEIQDSLIDFSNTRDGAHISVICICQSTNKVKKTIMKSFKGHMMEIAKSEHGHLLLLALFDTVDDTVLLKKMMMPQLLANLWDLVNDKHGRKVVLYLVAHRDPTCFHPSDIAMLKESVALGKGKKDINIRITEIREAILGPLLEEIGNDVKKWMSNNSMNMLTLAILKCGSGALGKLAFEKIADHVCETSGKIAGDGKECFIVEDAGIHMMLKKLIVYDKERIKLGEEITFCHILSSKLSKQVIKQWIKFNRGCFLLILLLECTIESVVEDVYKKLQPHIKIIKQENSQGAKILQKKLEDTDLKIKDEHIPVNCEESVSL
ncbi:hypothetical protein C0J52_22863 [Blattella germanica]|nr:hypothetical protein C0J52_22863 [Blattella germanica]